MSMISVSVGPTDGPWFGVAEHGGLLVATATGSSADEATRFVIASLPRGAEYQVEAQPTESAHRLMLVLTRLVAGAPEAPSFALCPDCIHEPLVSVAQIAAVIPPGLVATYGGIAAAAARDPAAADRKGGSTARGGAAHGRCGAGRPGGTG